MNILASAFLLALSTIALTGAESTQTAVRFDFKAGQTDGGFASELQAYLDKNPTQKVITVTPFSQGQGTSAVVVVFESPRTVAVVSSQLTQPPPQQQLVQGTTTTQPKLDPLRPRPRPQVVKQQQVRPAIFQENKFGTQNIGAVAFDAKWSNYGQYLQKMIETVQIQWERILTESRVYPPSGTSVKVVFRLNAEGRVSEIVSVEGSAASNAGKACTSAITAKAPYGSWTEEMITTLGQSQELTFTFFYQ